MKRSVDNLKAVEVVVPENKLEQVAIELEELLMKNNVEIRAKGPNILLLDKDTCEVRFF